MKQRGGELGFEIEKCVMSTLLIGPSDMSFLFLV